MSKIKNTIIVNLFAGPGAGKSTSAAGIFHKLKSNDVDCELINEFAKEKTWEQNSEALNDQFFISASQHYKQSILNGKVDVVITDSPLLIGLFYYNEKNKIINRAFNIFIEETFKRQNNVNFFIRRKKKFNPNGRNHNEIESKSIDESIKTFLQNKNIPFYEIDGDSSCVSIVYDMIVGQLGGNNEVR